MHRKCKFHLIDQFENKTKSTSKKGNANTEN